MTLEQNTMTLEVSDTEFGETLRELCLSMDPRQAVVDSFAAMVPGIRARLYCFESTGRSGHWFWSKNVAGHGSASILTDATLKALRSRVGQGPSVVSLEGLERSRDEIAALARLCANARLREATHLTMVIPGDVTCWLSLDGDDRASFGQACALLERSAKQIQHCLSSQAAFAASFRSSLGASGLLEAISEPAFLLTRQGIPLACNAPAKQSFERWPGWLSASARGEAMPSGVNIIPMKLGEVDMDLVLAKALENAEEGVNRHEAANGGWSANLGLTPSLQRVANLMVEGLSDRLIAEQLGLTFNSVRTYARRIYATTGVKNRVELTRLALHQQQR
jgi:DNA-binding CsgD family transcriptional regulator